MNMVYKHTLAVMSLFISADSGQSSAAAVGVCAAVLLMMFAATAGVIYSRRRISRNGKYHIQIQTRETSCALCKIINRLSGILDSHWSVLTFQCQTFPDNDLHHLIVCVIIFFLSNKEE